jgi:GT2 family glycosyltransferase
MNTVSNTGSELGFVVIGRNEGLRLKDSLSSIRQFAQECQAVYVDSGSTDGSVALARSMGAIVVELDLSVPFTAARARNAGFRALLECHPTLTFVQFLDGDCKIAKHWKEVAKQALRDDPAIAVVSGRRREMQPESSIFNQLIDIEWNRPAGPAKAVLGDMCVRVSAFQQIGGFREDVIAAEDDELCIRIRRAGYRVNRVADDMSEHNANITRVSQWYRRSMRGGHGYANINSLHGYEPERYFARELRSVVFWGGLFPVATIVSAFANLLLASFMVLIYVLMISRSIIYRLRTGASLRVAVAYGFLIYTGKIAEFLGVLAYWKNRVLSRQHRLIEYK